MKTFQLSPLRIAAVSLFIISCEGSTGSSPDYVILSRIKEEAAGANCRLGGSRVEIGHDINKNGILDNKEVTDTTFVCELKYDTLVREMAEPAGDHCEFSGLKIEWGLDSNENGVLNSKEILETEFRCFSRLGKTGDEPAGTNCEYGGQSVASGLDSNGNDTLEAGEISETVYNCFAFPDVLNLPLADIDGFEQHYIGAFRTAAPSYGPGKIAVDSKKNTVFITGSVHKFSIGEYSIPALVNTRTDFNALNVAPEVQPQVDMLPKIPRNTWAPDPLDDRIRSLYLYSGQLIVGGAIYYDASTTNKETHFIVTNPADLAGSEVKGLFSVKGYQHTTAWMSEVSLEWKSKLGATHVLGGGQGIPIIGRLSIGPSLFSLDISKLLSAVIAQEVPSKAIIDYPIEHPLAKDFLNYGGTTQGQQEGLTSNTLHTVASDPFFGFIIPKTRTYAVFGSSAGHAPLDNPYVGTMTDGANKNGTLFYKNLDASWTDLEGNHVGGYSVYDPKDQGPFYWFFDMKEVLTLANPWDARPYAWGYYKSLFSENGERIPDGSRNSSYGGYWDQEAGRLYLSWPYRDNKNDPEWTGAPVIAVYDFSD